VRFQSCEKAMSWCIARCCFGWKPLWKSCNFEPAYLKKKKKKKEHRLGILLVENTWRWMVHCHKGL